MSSRVAGDLHVTGTLTAGTMYPSAGTVTDASVSATSPIGADKLEHQYVITRALSPHELDISTTREVLHCVYGATGTLLEFSAGSTVIAGATTTITIDLYKNGSTILTTTITLTSSNTAYILEDAVISNTAVVVGDVLEVVVTGTGVNEPRGVFVRLVMREDAD